MIVLRSLWLARKGLAFFCPYHNQLLSLVTLAQTALYLAHLFVDYESGIHYPQMQMQRQSGTNGINSIRI